jgi:hypothetical protein
VFGEVRYMFTKGFERKARPKEYVEKVERLIEEGRAEAFYTLQDYPSDRRRV